MFGNLRINIIRQLVEASERLFFNPKLLRLYKRTFGNQLNVAIDVGVNRGQTVDLLLKVNPDCKVYGFEPNPELFAYLTKKYAGKENVRLFQTGISAESGTKNFHENVLHSTSSLEKLDYGSAYLKQKARILGVLPKRIIARSYPVQVVSLSDFITAVIGAEKIDLVKIDTEGHEYSCLQGLFGNNDNHPRWIQLEHHNDGMYANARSFSEINAVMTNNNYRLKEKIKHLFGDFDEMFYEALHGAPAGGNGPS